jgi:two-component system sensor histidine kinase KdpD
VVDYASEHNISTVVVGRSRRGFRFGRTMSDAIAAAGDHFDVIEVGHTTVDPAAALNKPTFKVPAPSARSGEKRARFGWTLLACMIATALMAAFSHADLANIAMIYMLIVVLMGVRFGRGPAVFSALLNVLAFDFFFVPPRFSLMVHDVQYVVTFAVMLVAGVVIGQLAGGIRYQASVAAHREKRARTLYEFTRDISNAQTTSEVIDRTENFMARQFRALVAVLVPDATGALVSPTSHGMKNPADATTAQWAYEHSRPAGAGTDTLAGSEYIFLPLKSTTRTRGVLAFRPERTRDLLIPEQRHQFDVFAALAATALERVHFMDVARDAMLMARIQGGDLKLELQRKSLRELVEIAVKSLSGALATHPVTIDVASELPLVNVDAALVERVLVSLVGNVAKHTPAETPMAVRARVQGEMLEVAVEDEGPGLPGGREEEIFETFQRGEHQPPRKGAGLGLAISRAIVEAHGGTIRAEQRARGARVVFTLPVKRKAPGQ